jgi:hypothetical protein
MLLGRAVVIVLSSFAGLSSQQGIKSAGLCLDPGYARVKRLVEEYVSKEERDLWPSERYWTG